MLLTQPGHTGQDLTCCSQSFAAHFAIRPAVRLHSAGSRAMTLLEMTTQVLGWSE